MCPFSVFNSNSEFVNVEDLKQGDFSLCQLDIQNKTFINLLTKRILMNAVLAHNPFTSSGSVIIIIIHFFLCPGLFNAHHVSYHTCTQFIIFISFTDIIMADRKLWFVLKELCSF